MTAAERIKIWKEKGEVMIAGGCHESDYEDFIDVLISEIDKRDEALQTIMDSQEPTLREAFITIGKLREALNALLGAMKRYEYEVDEPPTYAHLNMIKKAREALGEE